jgi:hypothetical protein
VDARALEQAKRRWAKQLWKTLDANPDLTHEQRRSVMLTGYVSEAARQAADEEWRRCAEESRRRAAEQQRRADLERLLLERGRRAGFLLVHAEDGLKWERVRRPHDVTRQRGASRERRPSRSRRIARSSVGSRGDPGDPDPDPIASWGGVVDAAVRMHAHVLRRAAAMRLA